MLVRKLVTELIGTFFLVLTIGCTVIHLVVGRQQGHYPTAGDWCGPDGDGLCRWAYFGGAL